jgi:hypothetical protein
VRSGKWENSKLLLVDVLPDGLICVVSELFGIYVTNQRKYGKKKKSSRPLIALVLVAPRAHCQSEAIGDPPAAI